MGEPFELPVERVRRNRWLFGLAMAPFVAAILFLTGVATVAPAALAFACASFIAMLGFAAYELARSFWEGNPMPRFVRGDLEVSDDEVRLPDGKILSRRRLVGGYVVPREEQHFVRLRVKGRRLPIELRVHDEESGRRLLVALGLDASQMVAQFPSVSRAFVTLPGALIYGFVLPFAAIAATAAIGLLVHPLTLATVVPLIGTLALRLALEPTEISVGADGIAWSWYGRRRFIGHDRIARIEQRARTPWLTKHHAIVLVDGEEILLPAMSAGNSDAVTGSLVRRIEDAREAYRRGEVETAAAAMHRGDREMRAWVASLRALGSGATADHRVAPIEPERLWRVVEDPASRAVDRAAAAVALSARCDASEKRRLEAISDATAAPKLRVALRAVTDGDDAEIEAALAEFEEAKPARAL